MPTTKKRTRKTGISPHFAQAAAQAREADEVPWAASLGRPPGMEPCELRVGEPATESDEIPADAWQLLEEFLVAYGVVNARKQNEIRGLDERRRSSAGATDGSTGQAISFRT